MDSFQQAQIYRGLGLIQSATSDLPTEHQQKAAFLQIARSMALQQHAGEQRKAIEAFRDSDNPLLQKAAVSAMSYNAEPFQDSTVRGLMAGYIESIAQLSALDMLKQYARPIMAGSRHTMIGSGFVADATVEGAPKVVRRPSLTLGDVEPHKTVALIVATRELMMTGGDEALAMLDSEMSKSITRAINQAIYAHFDDSNAEVIYGGNEDALADMRLAIRSAGPSDGYVVIVPPGVCADLALRPEAGPNFSMNGGEYRPGLHIVEGSPVENRMMVIPASRTAVFDGGLELRPSGEAAVEMSDDPQGAGEMVSLWQSGSVGLLAERQWHIGGDAQVAIVEGYWS